MLNYQDNGRIVGFALANAEELEAIASKPMASFATAFVKAYLKAKTSSLDDIQAFGKTVGMTTLLQSADKLSPAEALSLVKRVDQANGAKAATEPTWMRGHLVKLLSGEVSPAPVVKAEKPPKKPATRKKRSVMDETDAFAAKRPSRAGKNE